jgi:hypothetical protein
VLTCDDNDARETLRRWTMGLRGYRFGLEPYTRRSIHSNYERPQDGRHRRITGQLVAFTCLRAQTPRLEGQSRVTAFRQNQNGPRNPCAPQLAKKVECAGGWIANAQNDQIKGQSLRAV